MVAQGKTKPTVAPELSSRSGAASSSRQEVLGVAEDGEYHKEPSESLDDWAPRECWACEACGSLNLRTSHHCSRTGCNGRLPHRLRAGDWECHQCGHMNRQWRDRCNWSHCPSNDWECPSCGNSKFGDRRFCNGRDPPCAEPGRDGILA